jgi:D-amino peptidase
MAKMYNVFISFDMEGISAVSSWREIKKGSPSLNALRTIATAEVNAAIRGIRNSEQSIHRITICDAHAFGENIMIEELDPGVQLVKGTPGKNNMIEGIDKNFDVAFFIGYHSMAGTKYAGMDHTFSSRTIHGVRINGRYVGETEINAALAGYYGVPLGLVTGDDSLIAEVRRFFGQKVETVITKRAVSRFAAQCRHPNDVHQEIETKAARVMQKINKLKLFRFKSPIKAEIDFLNSLIADLAELVPGVKRTNGRRIVFRTKDTREFYRMLRLMCSLGGYANSILT